MTKTASRTRAIAYLRVSTDKQADHGVSLDAQDAKVRAYAMLYDVDLVSVEVDAGASAKSLDGRPALAHALDTLRRGDADALLVVKLDRLTRSVRDLGDIVERCQREGWALLSVSENLDTRSAAGRLVLNILASVGQWEREAIGERTSVAMAQLRADHRYTGGEIPYGFRLGDDGRTLVEHANEQTIKQVAREKRSSGLSLRAIGAALEARGLPPRNGGRWHAKTIRALVA